MRAYSMDIRERVIENLDHESMRKTAKRLRVSDYFVYRLKQRYREAGTLAPKPHGGGHGLLVDEAGAGS
jgi:transposase